MIEPKRDGGKIILDCPHLRYSNQRGLALHSYGAGPFCKFSISDSYHRAGVYVLVVEGRAMYVGETEDLSRRYNSGYGTISPRNCYVGGQSTNCRINALILAATKSTAPVYLWFTPTAGYKQLEREMIQSLQPNWNRK